MQAHTAKGGYGEFRDGWPVVTSAMLGIGLGTGAFLSNFFVKLL